MTNDNSNQARTTNAPVLKKLWDNGVLMDLSVSYPRGRTRLDAEEIRADPERMKDIVRLGHKSLFSDEMMEGLKKSEARARNLLQRNSLPFPVGKAHFVPLKTYPSLTEELDDAKATFYGAVEDFMAAYDSNRAVMLERYPELLSEDDYPAKEDLRFRLDYHSFTLAPESEIAGAKIKSAVDEFVRDSVATLRAKVVETCQAQAQRLQEGKGISSRQLESLRRMVEQFQSLNFVGDQSVEQVLSQLRQQIATRTPEEFKGDEAKDALARVLDLTITTAADEYSAQSAAAGYTGRVVNLGAPMLEAEAAGEAA